MRVLRVFLFTLLCPMAWADSLVIQRVTVIDATGKAAQPSMTVVIEQDRIAVIGPWTSVKAPAGSHIVDGRGKFLIPGLWDMHVHAFATESGGKPGSNTWMYPLYLVNGIVGVRVMWRMVRGSARRWS
jgi:imidazolonepropionase-like amidohydrolase